MSDLRCCLVVNDKSASDAALRSAISHLRRDDLDLDVRISSDAQAARRHTREAVEAGFERVIAGGGDGTLNSVVRAVLESEAESVSVGLVPLGTGNDFARGAGIPLSPREALLLAVAAEPMPIDVGWAGDRPFVNMATGGFGAEVTVETPEPLKRVLGGAAYGLMGVMRTLQRHPRRIRVTLAEGESLDEELLLVAIANGRSAGGGFLLAPHALLDDGRLDLVMIPDFEGSELGALISELTELDEREPERVTYRQTAGLQIECDEELPFNLDGEPMRARELELTLDRRRLLFALPEDAPIESPD